MYWDSITVIQRIFMFFYNSYLGIHDSQKMCTKNFYLVFQNTSLKRSNNNVTVIIIDKNNCYIILIIYNYI